jgi:hypothetical protein
MYQVPSRIPLNRSLLSNAAPQTHNDSAGDGIPSPTRQKASNDKLPAIAAIQKGQHEGKRVTEEAILTEAIRVLLEKPDDAVRRHAMRILVRKFSNEIFMDF